MNYQSVVLNVDDLMILTKKSYRVCLKLRKEWLIKCGKEPTDMLTIKDFCKIHKMKVKDLLSILKAGRNEEKQYVAKR